MRVVGAHTVLTGTEPMRAHAEPATESDHGDTWPRFDEAPVPQGVLPAAGEHWASCLERCRAARHACFACHSDRSGKSAQPECPRHVHYGHWSLSPGCDASVTPDIATKHTLHNISPTAQKCAKLPLSLEHERTQSSTVVQTKCNISFV
jgi:hypothetical protein